MAVVLTVNDTVTCDHGGKVSTLSTAKLTVKNAKVLTKDGVMGKSVAGPPPCPIADAPAVPTKKCQNVLTVAGTFATKLTVGSQPVMIDPIVGTTDGISPPAPPTVPPPPVPPSTVPGLKDTPAATTKFTTI